MKKKIYTIEKLGEKAVMYLKDGAATIEPLSLVNNAFGHVTFRMVYAGTKYESTEEVPFIDLPGGGQVQVSWTEDEELEVVFLSDEEA